MNRVSARSFSAESSVTSPAPWFSHCCDMSNIPIGWRWKEKHQSLTCTKPSRQKPEVVSKIKIQQYSIEAKYMYRTAEGDTHRDQCSPQPPTPTTFRENVYGTVNSYLNGVSTCILCLISWKPLRVLQTTVLKSFIYVRKIKFRTLVSHFFCYIKSTVYLLPENIKQTPADLRVGGCRNWTLAYKQLPFVVRTVFLFVELPSRSALEGKHRTSLPRGTS